MAGGAGGRGYSVTELLIVVAIIATLAAIAIPNMLSALFKAKMARVLADLRNLEISIAEYEAGNGYLPEALDEVRFGTAHDPWGSTYCYLKIRGAVKPPHGKWRKDRFLVPINTDYDLYSKGPDGDSKPPLTAHASRDDIIRAADGAYLGPASEY